MCVCVCVFRVIGDVWAVWVFACVCGGGGEYICIVSVCVGGGVRFLVGIIDVHVI